MFPKARSLVPFEKIVSEISPHSKNVPKRGQVAVVDEPVQAPTSGAKLYPRMRGVVHVVKEVVRRVEYSAARISLFLLSVTPRSPAVITEVGGGALAAASCSARVAGVLCLQVFQACGEVRPGCDGAMKKEDNEGDKEKAKG